MRKMKVSPLVFVLAVANNNTVANSITLPHAKLPIACKNVLQGKIAEKGLDCAYSGSILLAWCSFLTGILLYWPNGENK